MADPFRCDRNESNEPMNYGLQVKRKRNKKRQRKRLRANVEIGWGKSGKFETTTTAQKSTETHKHTTFDLNAKSVCIANDQIPCQWITCTRLRVTSQSARSHAFHIFDSFCCCCCFVSSRPQLIRCLNAVSLAHSFEFDFFLHTVFSLSLCAFMSLGRATFFMCNHILCIIWFLRYFCIMS